MAMSPSLTKSPIFPMVLTLGGRPNYLKRWKQLSSFDLRSSSNDWRNSWSYDLPRKDSPQRRPRIEHDLQRVLLGPQEVNTGRVDLPQRARVPTAVRLLEPPCSTAAGTAAPTRLRPGTPAQPRLRRTRTTHGGGENQRRLKTGRHARESSVLCVLASHRSTLAAFGPWRRSGCLPRDDDKARARERRVRRRTTALDKSPGKRTRSPLQHSTEKLTDLMRKTFKQTDTTIDYRCEDKIFPVCTSCVTIQTPDLLCVRD